MLGIHNNHQSRIQGENRNYFRISSSRHRIRLEPPKPIWSRTSRGKKWGPFLFFILAIIFAYVSLSHATPPRSRGARPIALGGGYVAAAGDPYSLFYNPGALAEINQKEFVLDYGRWHGEREPAGTEFNGIYATPYRYKDRYLPIAVGLNAEGPAEGAHIVDLTAGSGMDAPMEKWTKGIIKFPVRLGAAFNIRQQKGDQNSARVGGSSIALGLTGGAFIPLSRVHQFGVSLRHLYAGDGDPRGPTLNAGMVRRHSDRLSLFAELEWARGGVWRFKPGAELSLHRGVVRPRIGWGYRDSGVDHVATGIGFYVSPLQIDLTYIIPIKTLNDNSDQFRASFSYRFGEPQFSEVYYDRALEAASQLDQRVLTMTVEEAELKSSLSELEQKRRLASEDLRNLKARIEALKDHDILGQRDAKIKRLEAQVADLTEKLNRHRATIRRQQQQKATVRIHEVQPGDTLQSIAQKYYGSPNQWKEIYNRNADKIERGLPKVGAKLVIP